MKRLGFIGSIISVFLGVTMLFTTSVMSEFMPKLVHGLFSTAPSYWSTDCEMDFSNALMIAFVLIICGLVFGVSCYISENPMKK